MVDKKITTLGDPIITLFVYLDNRYFLGLI